MASPFSIPQTPLAVAMSGLDLRAVGVDGRPPGGERVRAILAWLARAGARAVQIDATTAGIRPRELDRSGRRDLAALLRRLELVPSGVDAFVPADHLLRADTVDRAVATLLGAIDLAGDLMALASSAVVTRAPFSGADAAVAVHLDPRTPADVRGALADRAASRGVRVADFAWPIAASAEAAPSMGVGLDPATALGAGADALALAAALGPRLVQARLSDIARAPGSARVPPGAGRLDAGAYLVTLAATGHTRAVVLDTQSLQDPGAAIGAAMGAVGVGPG